MPTRPPRVPIAVLAAVTAALFLPLTSVATAQALTNRVRIDLDQMTPRVVDAGTGALTIGGRVTNTGDRKLGKLQVRLQRGGTLTDEGELRSVLAEPQTAQAVGKPEVSGGFQDIARELDQGATASFQLTVPLGGDKGGLRIDRQGVYSIAINVNGVPDYGRLERVGALSTLLPVLNPPGGAPAPPPATPSRLGLIWPLVDTQPRLLRARDEIQPDQPPVLTDDGLAGSLAPGGRLFELVDQARKAASANSGLLRSLCFAIDPDLLDTVQAMTGGYLVRSGGDLVRGRGNTTAEFWLSRVRELVKGQCVIALPYADADLVALSRDNRMSDLRATALSSADRIGDVLGVAPMPGVVWPDGGTLDQRTIADLTATRRTTVLADASRVQRPEGTAPYAVGSSGNLRVLPYDPLVAASLAPHQASQGVMTSSVQNGLATLLFRAGSRAGETILITPPRRWSASGDEIGVFLATLQALQTQQVVTALPLSSLLDGTDLGTAAGLEYSAQDNAAEIPASVTGEVARLAGVQRDLSANVLTEDDTRLVKPADLLAPVRNGLIRSTSTAWRGQPSRAANSVDQVSSQLNTLLSQVTVNDPGRPFALASADSPIPVSISNGLPVNVRAFIKVSDTPGLRPESKYVLIPAGQRISPYVTTEVTRAGRFSVDIWLTTESGTPLGGTSRVELNSTSYGSITLAVTGIAAGALVLLVGLRLVRRVRRARAAAVAGTATERAEL